MSAPDPATASASFLSLPQAEARQRLLQSLARLAPVQRQIVGRRLCGVTDLDQIAMAVGCEPDAARLLLVQGIAQLRNELSEAPQDKNNNAWLKRCQALLIPPTRRPTPAPDTIRARPPEPDPAGPDRPRPEAEAPVETGLEPGAETGNEAETGAEIQTAAARPGPSAPARLGPRLLWPAGLALGAVIAVWAGQHYASRPPAPPPEPFDPEIAAIPEPVPEAVPQDTAEMQGEQAPLTASDLELVLLQQQHPELLENLDFYLWLVEKDALR